MASSKNPIKVIDVPQEIIGLATKYPGIICNLRINQQPDLESKTREDIRLWSIRVVLYDTWNFYEKMEVFLRGIMPGTRVVMVCQGFGEDIFTLITDVTNIYWADEHYPRIDFERRPRIVQKIFGYSNLWGGFILAAARVGKVKKQARVGYDLLIDLTKKPNGIISP